MRPDLRVPLSLDPDTLAVLVVLVRRLGGRVEVTYDDLWAMGPGELTVHPPHPDRESWVLEA